MTRTISVVRIDTGLVEERSVETISSDVPRDFADHATEASLDSSGRLHYERADGRAQVCDAPTRRLDDRQPADSCLVAELAKAGDRPACTVLHLCVVEPVPPGGVR